ncbi:CopG family transcriptional regulator [Bartonella sp. LJL80]
MRTRNTFYLEWELQRKLDDMAKTRQVSKTAIIEAAIASFLTPEMEDSKEAVLVRRLDKIGRQMDRIERDSIVALDTLALFIEFWLATIEPVETEAQAQARAKGKQRFDAFVTTLGKRLQREKHFIKEISNEINC